MIATIEQHYVLPPGVPTAVVFLLLAAGIAAWVLLRRLGRSAAARWLRGLLLALRLVVAYGTMLAAAQAAHRVVLLATNWPIWLIALGAAAAVEGALALYGLERRTVRERTSLALAGLRVAMVLLVVAMLTQPVRSLQFSQTLGRHVAVLVDSSASMHVAETQLTGAQKVRLAEMLSVPGTRRLVRLDEAARRLLNAHDQTAEQSRWLSLLGEHAPTARAKQLAARRAAMRKALTAARRTVAAQVVQVDRAIHGRVKLDDNMLAQLRAVKAALSVQVRDRLDEAIKIVQASGEPALGRGWSRLHSAVAHAASALGKLLPTVNALGEKLDEAFYASLSTLQRKGIDAAAKRTRFALARDVLLHRPSGAKGDDEPRPSLIDRLRQAGYGVKLFTFAAEPVEVDPAGWVAGYAGPRASAPAGKAAAAGQAMCTDIAGALRKAFTELPAGQLAGILLLTDGQHNSPRLIEPVARQIGLQQVPICPIVLGTDRPPTDAGIVAIESPETIYVNDTMYLTADLKLDGLEGKTVSVSLLDGKKEVDKKTVRVAAGTCRKRIGLTDTPKTTGPHSYRVKVQKFDGEAFESNNEYQLALSVTDDRIKVLLIEGRPRWEFRYLKNLFVGRDKTVRLQYVLTSPDRVSGTALRPAVAASVSRPLGQCEATAMPASEAEWMKFDAIILGDVSPATLRPSDLARIRKFVADRGGTLIVIAGPVYTPQAFSKTVLQELLPARFSAARRRAAAARPDARFHLALTDEGRESVIMRQSPKEKENLRIWNSLPWVYWRHPIITAKAGATVLAYAVPQAPPDFLKPLPQGSRATDQQRRRRRERRRTFQRRRALIMTQQVALGRVMFLSFDRTWRLRYRVGDTRHHKFWAQVLRWATGGKLPAGTALVKIGTDRSRYGPQARPIVRVKMVGADFSPLISDEVAVNVVRDGRVVLRQPLRYLSDSPGMYRAQLPALAAGRYRLTLDAPAAAPLLQRDRIKSVSTVFSVDPAGLAEQIELSANRGLLTSLAGLSFGGKVVEPTAAGELFAALGRPSITVSNTQQWTLWDYAWPLLTLLVALGAAEWSLRKKAGLA